MILESENLSIVTKESALVVELKVTLAEKDKKISEQEVDIFTYRRRLIDMEGSRDHWKIGCEKQAKEIKRLRKGILDMRHELHDGGSEIHLLHILNETLRECDKIYGENYGKQDAM